MSEEKKLKIEKVEVRDNGRYGKFVCEPLDRGFQPGYDVCFPLTDRVGGISE